MGPPGELDWTRGAGRPRAARASRVDVIVPVYGAAADLDRCLASVFAHTTHPVTVVLDGPQDADVMDVIARHPVTVMRNEQRGGFASAANRGMRATTGDVVLLNSDTVVTAGWLEKMIDAAYSSGDVGTVTPLSNNATICSVPRAFEANLLPAGFDTDSFAARIESVSARAYPRIPTGVGFCMYIRRALLDEIGFFDEEHFGFGYGEENDLCMRALERGWVHVAGDATFIEHAGHASFGPSARAREQRAVTLLRKRHPRYMDMIAECMRNDPLAAARRRITGALGRNEAGPKVVHVVHGWPPFQHGGTELYAYWLVARQRARHGVAVYARGADPSRVEREVVELDDHGVRVRIVTNHFTARDPFRRNAIRDRWLERDFERFLRDERPDIVHVHHLAGHTFSLARVAERLGIPIVMQLQDWWFLCARVNLLHRDGTRCSGPAPAKCAACVRLTGIPLANGFLHRARRAAVRAALRTAGAFIAGSNAIRDDYAHVLPPSTPFHVLPYGIAMEAAPRRDAVRRPVRFGYVGAIAPHKGVHVAVEAMRGIDGATLHLWGTVAPRYIEPAPHVVLEGTFEENDKPRVYASMDVLLMPSIGLESFGLVGREAMAAGVPVIATAGGALSEMAASALVPPGDVEALRAIVNKIVADPSIVERWREALPRPKSADAHAAEIEAIYRTVRA